MKKFHDLKTVVVNHLSISYFYTREKNDTCGNPRYRVYIIDPEAPTVYETIFKCYESQIKDYVTMFIERGSDQ